MSTEYVMLSALLDELNQKVNEVRRDPRACMRLSSDLQKVLDMSNDETIELLRKAYGYDEGDYIQKSAEPKTDPEPGPMRKLPLVDALARISVHIVERSDTRGLRLQCLRCGTQWDVQGFVGGDLDKPAGKYWMRCPAGCNMSAQWLWDENRPVGYNPLAEYKQP